MTAGRCGARKLMAFRNLMKALFAKRNFWWTVYFLAVAAAGISAVVILMGIQADEKGAFLFGYSIQRLLLVAISAAPALISVYAAVRTVSHPKWAEEVLDPVMKKLASLRWLGLVSAAFMLLGWLGLFVSPDTFGRYQAYFVRLRPVIVYLGFLSALSTAFAGVMAGGWKPAKAAAALKSERSLLLISAGVMACLCGGWLLIAWTGLGVAADPYFWNEAGVPVLGLQLISTLLLAGFVQRFLFSRDTKENRRRIDWGTALLLWLGAFFLWQFTFMPRSYFAPGPYPPNMVSYPYSDAERYDYSAEYMLLGQGIANGEYMDKPAYVFLLALLHLVSGQDYGLLVGLQVALLAFIPVGLYLLGKSLHSRLAGLILALLAVFQQRNAIAATLEIQVSHSKLLLTEFPAALLLIFCCLFVVRWFQSPERRTGSLLVSGGLLGLAVLVRPNALSLAPLLILLMLLASRGAFRRRAEASAWFAVVFIMTVLPWNLVIPKGFDTPYLIAKARSLFDTRYKLPDTNLGSGNANLWTSAPSRTDTDLPADHASAFPSNLSDTENEHEISYGFIPRHFFHNEIMAFFILPHQVVLKGLIESLQTPYWQNVLAWRGELPAGSFIMIFLNLGLLSAGIAAAWKRWRIAGLVPLLIQGVYFLANAVVRNSGARYLVPVDWALLLYYVLGTVQVLSWLKALLICRPAGLQTARVMTQNGGDRQTRYLDWRRGVLVAGLFLFIGSWLPLSKHVFSDRLPETTPGQILAAMRAVPWQDPLISAWLASIEEKLPLNIPGLKIVIGRGYYPRFYGYGEGESNGELAINVLPAAPEPRLTLRVLARDQAYIAVLPMKKSPSEIPDGVDTVVIGCSYGEGFHIDAAAVLLLTDRPEILWRESDIGLSCPLSQP